MTSSSAPGPAPARCPAPGVGACAVRAWVLVMHVAWPAPSWTRVWPGSRGCGQGPAVWGLWAGACCLGALLSRAPGWQASVLPSKSLCVKEKSLAQEGDTPGKFRITKDTGEAHCPPHVSALAPCCSAPRSRWCPTGRIYGGALSRPSGPFLSPRQAWRLWEGDNPTPSWGDPASAWCSWSPRAEPSASRSVPGPLGRPEATTPAPASGLSTGPLKSCAPPLRS